MSPSVGTWMVPHFKPRDLVAWLGWHMVGLGQEGPKARGALSRGAARAWQAVVQPATDRWKDRSTGPAPPFVRQVREASQMD